MGLDLLPWTVRALAGMFLSGSPSGISLKFQNIAPWIFTKLVSVRVKELREKGVKIFAYLDNWIIWESNPQRCRAALLKDRTVIAKC